MCDDSLVGTVLGIPLGMIKKCIEGFMLGEALGLYEGKYVGLLDGWNIGDLYLDSCLDILADDVKEI